MLLLLWPANKSVEFEAVKRGFVVDQHSKDSEGFGFAGHLISLSPAGTFLGDVESIIIEETSYVSIKNFKSDRLKDFRKVGDLAVAGTSFDSERQIGLFTSQGLNVKHEYVYAPGPIAGFSQIFGGTGITGSRAKVLDDSIKSGPAKIKLFVIYKDDTYSETTLNFPSSKLSQSEMKDLVRSLKKL